MKLRTLQLHDFRNFKELTLPLDPGLTVLYGANAQGKTNVLESVYLCCTGRSHRTRQDNEMIREGCPCAMVQLSLSDGTYTRDVRLHLNRRARKGVSVDGIPLQRLGELMGAVNGVLFSPEDLRLIKDGPQVRRRFLDMEISQGYPAYFYALQQYKRLLLQRNALLRRQAPASELLPWDEQLCEQGLIIAQRRQDFIRQLSDTLCQTHGALSASNEKAELRLISQIAPDTAPEEYLDALQKRRSQDVQRANTSFGVHLDDMEIRLNGHSARIYGSQGQQRTLALSLKLSVFYFMRDVLNRQPVLMLDDVLSELDSARQAALLNAIGGMQTLITCTDADALGALKQSALMVEVKSGRVYPQG